MAASQQQHDGTLKPNVVADGAGGQTITVAPGGIAASALPSSVGVGNYAPGWVGLNGQQVVTPLVTTTAADGVTGRRWVDPGGTSVYPVVGLAQFNGVGYDQLRGATVFKDIPSTAVTAGTPVTVWTPTAGKKFRLLGWCISSSVAGAVIWCDNAVGSPVARTGLLPAGAAITSPPGMGNGILSAAANNVLKADVTASGNISGFVFGTEE